MSSKKNILVMLENQIDKIILAVIVIISLAVLWLFVLSNPYSAKVGSKDYSPGSIDKKIKDNADTMLVDLEESSQIIPENYDFLDKFQTQLRCPIDTVAGDLVVQFPGVGDTIIEEDRLYDMPVVPALYDVQKAPLRGTARVPVDEVGPGNPYKNAESNLTDIDQITISGRFDVKSLLNNFQLSFNGPGLKSTWKDPKLATPVFAKMDLQRRVQQDNGTWSDWQEVPRTKIDMYQKLLSDLPMSPDEMQFGINVWMSQYQDEAVQLDILQPEPYQFQISDSDWMPPPYLIEANDLLEKQKEEEKRKLRDERQKKAQEARRSAARRPGGRDRRPTRERQPMRERQQDPRRDLMDADRMMFDRGVGGTGVRAGREKERTLQMIQKDMQTDMLKAVKQLKSSRDPVLVWAHDDTTVPGETYQYRIRLGVFNPIMGKNWFRQSQAALKDQTVLWSSYSEPTEPIEVPKMLHVFPMETLEAKTADRIIEGVSVEVAKYYMGRWQSYDFDVYPGQVIGDVVAKEDMQKADRRRGMVDREDMMMRGGDDGSGDVDFTTPLVMVDVLKEFSWGRRISKRGTYYQMAYYDAVEMTQLPVGKSNWPKDVKKDYDTVQAAMEEKTTMRPGMEDRGMPMPGMDDPFMMERPF